MINFDHSEAIRIIVSDPAGTTIGDPEKTFESVSSISFGTNWPGGFGLMTFQLRRQAALQWKISNAYKIELVDGDTELYSGKIEKIGRDIDPRAPDKVTVTCEGWHSIFAKRRMKKWYADPNAIHNFKRLGSFMMSQNDGRRKSTILLEKSEGNLRIQMAPKDLVLSAYPNVDDLYSEIYTMPDDGFVGDIHYKYTYRTGEGFRLESFNVSANLPDDVNTLSPTFNPKGEVGNKEIKVSPPSKSIEFRLYPAVFDLYDQNDWLEISNCTVYAWLPNAPDEPVATRYTMQNLITDVVHTLKGTEISGDYSLISESASTIILPFESNGYELGTDIMQRIVDYSDVDSRPWGTLVWGAKGSSDGKPRVVLERWKDSLDYEYMMSVAEFETFKAEDAVEELYNHITVQYVGEGKKVHYLSPFDNADLKDLPSIAKYGRLDYLLKVSTGKADTAILAGKRFLEYHKNMKKRGQFSVKGGIRLKSGYWVPCSRFRAGDRIYVPDFEGGTIFNIRQTQYNVESKTLTLTPDYDVPDIAAMYADPPEIEDKTATAIE